VAPSLLGRALGPRRRKGTRAWIWILIAVDIHIVVDILIAVEILNSVVERLRARQCAHLALPAMHGQDSDVPAKQFPLTIIIRAGRRSWTRKVPVGQAKNAPTAGDGARHGGVFLGGGGAPMKQSRESMAEALLSIGSCPER
jgi:hypothetical protein